MRKVALVFVLAVFVPSLVLAWLAVRSLRDQQFLIERQQSLLWQGVADRVAKDVQDALAQYQHDFATQVAGLLRERSPQELANVFDQTLRPNWPLAQVGFAVTLSGNILSPAPQAQRDAQKFLQDNRGFLGNLESAEVYLNQRQSFNIPLAAEQQAPASVQMQAKTEGAARVKAYQSPSTRNVIPLQSSALGAAKKDEALADKEQAISKMAPAPAEFRQLIADEMEGTLARFVDNKLSVLVWCRPAREPQIVFGAQLSLPRLEESLRPILQQVEPGLREEICIAVLDDTAKPVALSEAGFQAANWKRPFVASEIGEALPHWEAAIYLLNPAKLSESARTLKLTFGLLIAVLVLAIGAGSWLIVADLNRQLTLARQKTDFVSNVSHELKTPLTSIRMFSELLAEGRVADPAKQHCYLGIITAESARLTRLINNVLDFARLERGEKKYDFQACDLAAIARETAESYRPHLEANGFRFEVQLPETPLMVKGDRDALAQVVVNLLSNAEKYSDACKEITMRVEPGSAGGGSASVLILDRGMGVPSGAEEKIFEKFYRAHDSLNSGIQGSGLGLTLARQIAQAHGGDIFYSSREGGGSCFSLRLPVS